MEPQEIKNGLILVGIVTLVIVVIMGVGLYFIIKAGNQIGKDKRLTDED